MVNSIKMILSFKKLLSYLSIGLVIIGIFLILAPFFTIVNLDTLNGILSRALSDLIHTVPMVLLIIISGFIIYGFFLAKINNKSLIYNLWIQRTLFYSISCFTIVFCSYLIFSYFELLHTQVDSAQYMISALIQSEAAIIAILITMTLIAVQQSASSYSTRVIDIFKYGSPDFWIILIIYIGSIIYGLVVLKLIEGTDSSLSNHEIPIFILYSFSIFALISLIPYMWNTLDLLKPL